ncbi:MAG: GFA family protein, partial [Candidatus Binataceae bacterium]
AWFVLVKPDRFRLIAGAEAQAEYQWVPPGRPYAVLHYHFCRTCGVRAFGWGEHESMGGKWYFVSVASLDDADRDELAAAPIRYVDGRHDRFNQPPEDTRLM